MGAAPPEDVYLWTLSDGRNGVDFPGSPDFPLTQGVEMLNADYRNGTCGRRRNGSTDVVSLLTGSNLGGSPVRSMWRHLETGDDSAWIMFLFDTGTHCCRLPTSAVASNPSFTADFQFTGAIGASLINFASFNAKLQMFYTEGLVQDRHKVCDPNGNLVRYAGCIPGATGPAMADAGGAGAYPAVISYYRIRFIRLNGSVVVFRSEPTPAVAFTPSGVNATVAVTRPAVPTAEQPTHWEMELSPDNIYFYAVFSSLPGSPFPAIPIATVTQGQGVTIATYTTYPLSRVLGTYTVIPRARFGVSDGNRLVFGNFNFQGKGSRVGWTPVLGSLDEGDDERILQTATIKPYVDLNEKTGGDLTGCGQINGVIYQFKFREVWRMTPTTDFTVPYTSRRLSSVIGSINHKCIALGEDENGTPCLYFWSHKGPYRVSQNGIEYLGRDLEDLTRTPAGGLDILTTIGSVELAHSVFHADVGQWWVWWNRISDATTHLSVFDVKRGTRRDQYGVRGGWTRFTGDIATATCSTMGPSAVGAGSTVATRPWVGLTGNGKVSTCDVAGQATDAGTTYGMTIKTRSIYKFGRLFRIGEIVAIFRHESATPISLTMTLDKDFGVQLPTLTKSLPATQDRYLIVKFDAASKVADASALQIQIAEQAAAAGWWELVMLKIPVQPQSDI